VLTPADGHQAELERKLADQAETDGEMKELMRKKEELALDRAKMALTYAVRVLSILVVC
jgi:hypothetical protein